MSWYLIACCGALAFAGVALVLFLGLRWDAEGEHSWLAAISTVACVALPIRLMLSPCVALRWDVTNTRVVFLLPSRGAPRNGAYRFELDEGKLRLATVSTS